jgi:putative phosphoesterase
VYETRVRIASVSDLHVDFAPNRDALVKLATAIHRRGADAVVVAGDVSHVDDHIARALRAFRLAAPRVAYLPGNHDLWFARKDAARDPEVDSWKRYTTHLRALVESEDCTYLPAEPLEMDGVAIVGTTGWYDYSLLRPELRAQLDDATLASKSLGEAVWMDVRFAVFRDELGERMSDEAVARRMERELAAQLEDVDGNPEVRDVVVATHVVPFREALGPSKGLPWDFFDAYMGSVRLGEIIRSSKKVRACIYGHTHTPRAFRVGPIQVHGTPLGYPRERKGVDPEAIADRAVGWVELPEEGAERLG